MLLLLLLLLTVIIIIITRGVEMQIHAEFAGNYISCDVQCLRI